MSDRTRQTGDLVSDNNIFVDIVNDRVGIGTTVATAQLTVAGDINLTSGIITATSGIVTYYGGFVGNLTGTASTASFATTAFNLDGFVESNLNVAFAQTAGIATTATNVIGGIGSLTSLSVSGISTLGTVQISSGIITATSGIVTYYGDGQYLDNVVSGVGIQSGGTVIGTGFTTLNFIGTGNTFAVNGTTVDISISSGSSGSADGADDDWVVTSIGIHTTANVGIATTSPRANLDVTDSILISTGLGQTYDTLIKAYTNELGSLSFEESDSSAQYFSVSKDNSSTLFAVNNDSFESQFIVDSGGDVGIGTENPQAKLHVIGDARVGVNTSQGVILTSPNGTQYRLIVDDSGNLSATAV